MSKQVQEAYIVAATRTPIGRSHRGVFRFTRPVSGAYFWCPPMVGGKLALPA